MAKFCGKCGQPIEFCTCPKPRDGGGAGSGGGFSFAGRSFSVGAKIGSFTLGEGECLVRTYDIAKHLIGHGYIKLCITNKRAILLTENRGLLNTHNTTYYDETNLDKVQGISAGLDGRFSAFGIILGLFFIFLAIAALCIRGLLYYAFGPLKVFFAIALILLGIYFIVAACKPVVDFRITGGHDNEHMFTGVGTPGGSGRLLFFRKLASSFYPVKDFEKVITEAGACIYDLRTYGDEALKRWKRR